MLTLNAYFFCVDTSVQEVFYPISSLYYGVQKLKACCCFQLNSGCQQQKHLKIPSSSALVCFSLYPYSTKHIESPAFFFFCFSLCVCPSLLRLLSVCVFVYSFPTFFFEFIADKSMRARIFDFLFQSCWNSGRCCTQKIKSGRFHFPWLLPCVTCNVRVTKRQI